MEHCFKFMDFATFSGFDALEQTGWNIGDRDLKIFTGYVNFEWKSHISYFEASAVIPLDTFAWKMC